MTELNLPVIDVDLFLSAPESPEALKECEKAAEAIKVYGALVVKDSRVTEKDNDTFLNLVEDYFAQPTEILLADTRPDLHYQVGPTPELQEEPKCNVDPKCIDIMNNLPETERPLPINGPDPKWRFFWRYGERPANSAFPDLNAPQVIPKHLPEWPKVMDSWAVQMHRAVSNIAEMIAVGFGLPRDAITKLAHQGPHLLAPTASDLNKYGQLNRVLAGFHYDFNLLTIHGKSRFPGLHIWPRNTGERMAVKVPDGCLLVQAGKELEYLTGGVVEAGYHEVVINERTLKAMEKQKARNRPMWRISSTFFYHVASDQMLEPIAPHFNNDSGKYPSIICGKYQQAELESINLKKIK